MICVIDYGVGNVQSFLNVYKRLGFDACRATSSETLSIATHLLLPGVGHFDHAMKCLNNSGMRPTLERLVLDKKIPILGICVGMQIFASGSDEGLISGLNWIPGRVRAFAENPLSLGLPLPHMGWNTLNPRANTKLLSSNLDSSSQFYFLHSYYFDAQNNADVVATTNYGVDFDAVVSHSNIHGVQCHPEKSHKWGERLLKNFVEN